MMTTLDETTLALLRLLLADPRCDPDDLDWSVALEAGRRCGLLAHLADWLAQRDEGFPAPIGAAVAVERARAARHRAVMREVAARCEAGGTPYVFLKAARRYPDVGQDVDLLVPAHTPGLTLPGESVGRAARSLEDVLTGSELRLVDGIVLDVHRGRLGRLGEHAALAARTLLRRRRVRLGDVECWTPSREDELLLLAADRLYGRPALRPSDVLWLLATLREAPVPWESLCTAARGTSLLSALRCELAYATQIHHALVGQPVLGSAERRRRPRTTWGTIVFRDGAFRFPGSRAALLHVRAFLADLARGDWSSLGRRCLLPVWAAAAGWRALGAQARS